MFGKVLKVSSNDLYGNVDDREVSVFAAFEHLKYMNKYVIFTFKGEYDKNKLYYGSLHLKQDSIVIFSVNESVLPVINTFVNDYLNNCVNANEYSIIDISNYNKVELISYSNMDFDKLNELDMLSIPKVTANYDEETTKKKPAILYVLLVFMILLGLGVTYIYFMVDSPPVELKKLECKKQGRNKKIDATYDKTLIVKFDSNELVKENIMTEIYEFDELDYFDFKDNELHLKHFDNNYEFTYNDDNYELIVTYQKNISELTKEEIRLTMNKEGYTCVEGVYNE